MTSPLCFVPLERHSARRPSVIEQLAEIPEEESWLAKRTRARPGPTGSRHVMAVVGITSTDQLRQADHPHRAVVAWERHIRQIVRAAPSTVSPRPAPSLRQNPFKGN